MSKNTKSSPAKSRRSNTDESKAVTTLGDHELSAVSGGRITNIRVNANGITGGGPIPANAVL